MSPPAANAPGPFSSWRWDHAGLRVSDFDAAVDWYARVLDFQLVQRWGGGGMTFGFLASAADDGFRVELMAGPGATVRPPFEGLYDSLAPAGWHHLCLSVEDVDASVAELKRRGARIVGEPFDAHGRDVRIAFFADPWNNIFELAQTLPG